MGLEYLGDAGIGIIAAVLIVREVMGYLKTREASAGSASSADCDKAEETLTEIAKSTQAMSAILVKTDSDGLPLCYTPRSLTTAIESLASGIDKLSDKVERLGNA